MSDEEKKPYRLAINPVGSISIEDIVKFCEIFELNVITEGGQWDRLEEAGLAKHFNKPLSVPEPIVFGGEHPMDSVAEEDLLVTAPFEDVDSLPGGDIAATPVDDNLKK